MNIKRKSTRANRTQKMEKIEDMIEVDRRHDGNRKKNTVQFIS